MPSQGQFSNTPPHNTGAPSGSIRVLFKNINGQPNIKALTVSNADLSGDDIALSLNELDRITLPLSASGNISLDINSITDRNGYFFLDVEDKIINTISGSQDANISVSPFLTQPFFYNNYNAIISNAEKSEESFLKYDIDRSSGEPRPDNFNAIAGHGEMVFTMKYSDGTGGVAEFISDADYDTGSLNIVGSLTSSVQEFINNRDVDIKVLLPDLESAISVPQVSVLTLPDGLGSYTHETLGLIATSSLEIEIDNSANFNSNLVGAGGDRRRVTIATQTFDKGELNFTYNPTSISIDSGSMSTGNIFVRLLQQTEINSLGDTTLARIPTLRVRSFLSSDTNSDVDFLYVGQYFADQQPYAAKAPVQDSSYTDTGLINARYNGCKTDSADFGGIEPAISATTFEASVYRKDAVYSDNFICSQSLAERPTLETFLFDGTGDLPTSGTSDLGEIISSSAFNSTAGNATMNIISSTSDTSTIIRGVPQDLQTLSIGEFLTFTSGSDSEIVQVSNILNITATSGTLTVTSINGREIQVVRAQLGTTALASFGQGTTVTRFSGTRIFQIDGSRIIAANDKRLWIKDNRTIVNTDDRGFVTSTFTCTV